MSSSRKRGRKKLEGSDVVGAGPCAPGGGVQKHKRFEVEHACFSQAAASKSM